MEAERAREIYNKIKKDGLEAIDEYIAVRKAEELFLDFKRSADNGKGKFLDQTDRNNLAKAISGFGNSEGGVIVWGVDCSKDFDGADVAKAKHPIETVDRFVSLLQNVVSGCTTPPHSKVENHGIKQQGKASGFVITLVPKSMSAPHQCIYDYRYYLRAGSNFSQVPHAVLSGMFGRRPQPWVFLRFTAVPVKIEHKSTEEIEVLCPVGLQIFNGGQGIARDTFLNADLYSLPGTKCKAEFQLTDQTNWTGSFSFGLKLGVICKEDFRIPPENFAHPVVLNLSLLPPFEKELIIKLKCGCEGAESFDMEFNSDKSNVEKCYNEIIKKDFRDCQDLIEKLLISKTKGN